MHRRRGILLASAVAAGAAIAVTVGLTSSDGQPQANPVAPQVVSSPTAPCFPRSGSRSHSRFAQPSRRFASPAGSPATRRETRQRAPQQPRAENPRIRRRADALPATQSATASTNRRSTRGRRARYPERAGNPERSPATPARPTSPSQPRLRCRTQGRTSPVDQHGFAPGGDPSTRPHLPNWFSGRSGVVRVENQLLQSRDSCPAPQEQPGPARDPVALFVQFSQEPVITSRELLPDPPPKPPPGDHNETVALQQLHNGLERLTDHSVRSDQRERPQIRHRRRLTGGTVAPRNAKASIVSGRYRSVSNRSTIVSTGASTSAPKKNAHSCSAEPK